MSILSSLRDIKYREDTGKIYFTVDDLSTFPEFPEGPLIELLSGELYIVPSPSVNHQIISKNLITFLSKYVEEKNLGLLLAAPIDVKLSDEDLVIPDIVFVKDKNLKIVDSNRIQGSPDMIIEILSSNRDRDLIEKKRLYEQHGVSEYWVIDPTKRSIQQFHLENGRYSVVTIGDGQIISTTLNGLIINLQDIFKNMIIT